MRCTSKNEVHKELLFWGKGIFGQYKPKEKDFGKHHGVLGFPRWNSGKEPASQCRRCKRWRFDPCVGKIPWRRKSQPTLVFLPGKAYGQRSLAGYSPWHWKSSDTEQPSSNSRSPLNRRMMISLGEKGLAGGQLRQGFMSCKAPPKAIMPACHYYTGEAQSSFQTWDREFQEGRDQCILLLVRIQHPCHWLPST